MGFNPPPPPPSALQRLKNAYIRGAITVETLEERLEYLLVNDLARRSVIGLMPWEIPPNPWARIG